MNAFLASLDAKTSGKWLLLSLAVGLAAGAAAILFDRAVDLTMGVVTTRLEAFLSAGRPLTAAAALLAIMTLGGFLSGLVSRWSPATSGSGMDTAIDAFHNGRGRLGRWVAPAKLLASTVTLGSGGSGGKEGPVSLIAAALGAMLADVLKLTDRDRRILLVAGMAAGVGAVFRAPLAGALFAAEILYSQSDFEADAIIPAATSSIVGYCVYQLALPGEARYEPLFGAAVYVPAQVEQLGTYTVLALSLVAVAAVYVLTFRGLRATFARLPLWSPLRPALGGLLAACVGLAIISTTGALQTRDVLSTGYDTLQVVATPAAANGGAPPSLPVLLLLVIAFGKILTTSLTIASGGSGGVFGPSMVIGGCVGAAAGQLFASLVPGYAGPVESYAVVGMAGFFAGCARAPFSTVIMVSELTGGYELLLPTLGVSTLCFLLSGRLLLYPAQVATRLESPAHRGDFIVDVLEGLKVEEVYDRQRAIVKIPEQMPLEEIVHVLANTRQHYFPVVDARGRMIGIFASDDVRSYLYDETLWHLANARDVMTAAVVSVTPDDDLGTAIRGFTSVATDELPVVDVDDRGELLGTLRHKDAIAAYNRRLIEYERERAE